MPKGHYVYVKVRVRVRVIFIFNILYSLYYRIPNVLLLWPFTYNTNSIIKIKAGIDLPPYIRCYLLNVFIYACCPLAATSFIATLHNTSFGNVISLERTSPEARFPTVVTPYRSCRLYKLPLFISNMINMICNEGRFHQETGGALKKM